MIFSIFGLVSQKLANCNLMDLPAENTENGKIGMSKKCTWTSNYSLWHADSHRQIRMPKKSGKCRKILKKNRKFLCILHLYHVTKCHAADRPLPNEFVKRVTFAKKGWEKSMSPNQAFLCSGIGFKMHWEKVLIILQGNFWITVLAWDTWCRPTQLHMRLPTDSLMDQLW